MYIDYAENLFGNKNASQDFTMALEFSQFFFKLRGNRDVPGLW